jgi:hypothetical protein
MVVFKHENDAQRFGSQPTRMMIFVNSRNHGQGIREVKINRFRHGLDIWHIWQEPSCAHNRGGGSELDFHPQWLETKQKAIIGFPHGWVA